MRRSYKHIVNPVFRYKSGHGGSHTLHLAQPRHFSATLDRDLRDIRVGQTIIFNKVITNSHGDYDKYSGTFTCVEPGPYFLTVTIGSYPGCSVRVDIFQNSAMRRQVIASSSNSVHGYGTGSCVLTLKAGDKVWIQMSDFPSRTVTKWYSEINGFLIR